MLEYLCDLTNVARWLNMNVTTQPRPILLKSDGFAT